MYIKTEKFTGPKKVLLVKNFWAGGLVLIVTTGLATVPKPNRLSLEIHFLYTII